MDAADEAQKHTDAFLLEAVNARRAGSPEEQLRDNAGVVICKDCGEPIPRARLASIPDAVRCRDCQELWEESL